MKTLGIVTTLALLLVASVSMATIKWEQMPIDGACFWSQYDPCEGWTALAADDFLCTDGEPITGIEWWGIHVPIENPAPTMFIIRFYSDVPADPPNEPWSHPGDLLFEEECIFFTEVWEEEYQQFHYYLDLMTPFEQVMGTVYWISVQAVVCLPDVGWCWCECDAGYYWNDEAVWTSENPDPNWYFPEWTPVSVYTGGVYYSELAFRLISNPASPVEEKTWGGIKALYR